MEQVKRARLIHTQQLEDVPELIQRIQSLLPAKEAAQTCILSKPWLRAWSTIPSIRFSPSVDSLTKQNQRKYMSWIYRTLLRYHRDNLPITTLDIQFGIHTASRYAQKLIKQATSKSSIKELHLAIFAASFTLPDEIFSSENLNMLSIKLIWPKPYYRIKNNSLHISSNPVIDCMNLRVLELLNVHISEEVLHQVLSNCKLLEKINLKLPQGLKKIKVNNLRYLHELKIWSTQVDILETDDVPCLHSLLYNAVAITRRRPVLFKMDTIGSLRELYLDNVSMDDALSDMIKSNFPSLENLTLKIYRCRVEILDIRCVTLQSLKISFWEEKQLEVQVYAPKLLCYEYTGFAVPSILFPIVAPKHINLHLILKNHTDHLFFLKIREALKLSSKFNIAIHGVRHGFLPLNIADLRTMVPFPATNVEKLFFLTVPKEGLWENIFDAAFSICHPMYIKSDYALRLKFAYYFLKLIVKGEMKFCLIRNPHNGRWITLTSSSLSLLNKTTPPVKCVFKLSWCSS